MLESATVDASDVRLLWFLTLLKHGKPAEAVDDLLESSPLLAKKPGVREQLVGQFDQWFEEYGPVMEFEKLGATHLGTMAVRHLYSVQYQDSVVFAAFTSVRTGSGWRLHAFDVNNDPQDWLGYGHWISHSEQPSA